MTVRKYLDQTIPARKHEGARRRPVWQPVAARIETLLAEVDFFEVLVDVEGTRRKAWLFLMRLMYSGRNFAWIYERQDQVSFLDGHVRALAHFGGTWHL